MEVVAGWGGGGWGGAGRVRKSSEEFGRVRKGFSVEMSGGRNVGGVRSQQRTMQRWARVVASALSRSRSRAVEPPEATDDGLIISKAASIAACRS